MATSWPKSLDTLFYGTEEIGRVVSLLTDGKFEITAHPGGALVPALNVLDAVQQGAVECGHTSAYYAIGKSEALGFSTGMPFGLASEQHMAWLFHGGGLEVMRKVFADFSIVNVPMLTTGCQMGGWFNKKVDVVQDFAGLKMRLPSWGARVLSEMGVSAVNVPAGEIFLALKTGALDAAEWIGPYDDEKLGLHKHAKYYYAPGWWEPGGTMDILIGEKHYNALPSEYKAALDIAAKNVTMRVLARYDARNMGALNLLVAQGTELRTFSEDILTKSKAIAFELYSQMAAKNPSFKTVYEHWNKFLSQANRWNRVSEVSYETFALRTPALSH